MNYKNILSAVITGVLIAALSYLSSLTSIFDVSGKQILDISVLAAITSLLKALSTTSSGKFLGMKIK